MSASKDLTVRVWSVDQTASALCQRMEYAAGMFTNLATPAVHGYVSPAQRAPQRAITFAPRVPLVAPLACARDLYPLLPCPFASGGVQMFASSFGGGVFAYRVHDAGIDTVARTPPEQEGRLDA